MPASTLPELKSALVGAGFEVYRSRTNEVHIAERVRDNLIMDSGVSVQVRDPLHVRLVIRAQQSDFPYEGEEELLGRARSLGETAIARGFVEASTQTTRMNDPADAALVLDTWYEVVLEKPVDSVDAAMSEARFAVALPKIVAAGR